MNNMIVLHATEEQYLSLNGYKNDCFAIEFVKDGSDKWIINVEVLDDPNFSDIHDKLNELERVEYVPVPEIEENE